jgi:transposase
MRKRKRYNEEFKLQALKRVDEPGVTAALVAEELGISTRQLSRWRDMYKTDGKDAFPGQGNSRDEDITRLKRELVQVKKERDFLAEAARFFAKESK